MNGEKREPPRAATPKVQPAPTGQPDVPRSRFAKLGVRASQFVGAGILLVVITVVGIMALSDDTCACEHENLTLVTGYGGGLKADFLNDPAVKEILEERYNLRVDITAVGSLDIACNIELTPEDDFVWLGDSVALEQHRQCGGIVRSTENIYYSPVVLYSWTPVVDALVEQGVARLEKDGTYSIDFAQLTALVEAGQTWSSLELPLHDKISVQTTHPERSNSGFLFAGLLATTMNGGAVVNTTTVTPLLPRIQTFILRGGYMPGRSSELWELFLVTGMGAKPIVTLYESQIIEHVVANPALRATINEEVRILYPEPTVWATHPYVTRTEEGERLMEALLDPDIQRLAAENHGQRPSVLSVPFAPDLDGIRINIPSVVSMPSSGVMDRILAAIDEATADTTPPDFASPTATLPDE